MARVDTSYNEPIPFKFPEALYQHFWRDVPQSAFELVESLVLRFPLVQFQQNQQCPFFSYYRDGLVYGS
jgi:hypothetical protein